MEGDNTVCESGAPLKCAGSWESFGYHFSGIERYGLREERKMGDGGGSADEGGNGREREVKGEGEEEMEMEGDGGRREK